MINDGQTRGSAVRHQSRMTVLLAMLVTTAVSDCSPSGVCFYLDNQPIRIVMPNQSIYETQLTYSTINSCGGSFSFANPSAFTAYVCGAAICVNPNSKTAELMGYVYYTDACTLETVQDTYLVTIGAPGSCCSSALKLPTKMQSFTVVANDGFGYTHEFQPATDTVGTVNGDQSICGTKTYITSISPVPSTSFLTIVPPVAPLDPFVDTWRLVALPTLISQIGTYSVTLTAGLSSCCCEYQYVDTFTITVVHPCMYTSINPPVFPPISHDVHQPTPTTATFTPATDTWENTNNSPGYCLAKTYISNNALVTITAPAGNVYTDPWTISAFTNNVALVGTQTVTITITLTTWTAYVASVTASFDLTFSDKCSLAVIDNLAQTITPMEYTILISTVPSTSTFQQFSDDVAVFYSKPPVCGPRTYTILEGYPWLTIIPPTPGLEFTNPWTLSVSTTNFAHAGVYNATLSSKLVNYPAVLAQTALFSITIKNPCSTTVINPIILKDMTFLMGKGITLIKQTQEFSQIKDTIAMELAWPEVCGERNYTVDSFPFLQLVPPLNDPWTEPQRLEVYTKDLTLCKNYTATLTVTLVSYPEVVPLKVKFKINIVEIINKLPYFTPKMATQIEVIKTPTPETWTFNLPPFKDDDPADVVKLTGSLGGANSFATFTNVDGKASIEIKDTSKAKPGFYIMSFTLDDNKDQVKFSLSLIVIMPTLATPPPAQFIVSMPTVTTPKKAATSTASETKEEKPAAVPIIIGNNGFTGVPQTKLFDWKSAFDKLSKKSSGESKEVERRQPVPPNPYYAEINQFGQVKIRFETEILGVPEPAMINNGTMLLDAVKKRHLQAKDDLGKKVPVFIVEVMPGAGSNSSALAFQWNVTAIDKIQMEVQLYFDNPLAISTGYDSERIKVTFNDLNLFISAEGLLMDKKKAVIERALPTMAASAGALSTASGAASSAKTVVMGNLFFNIILQVLFPLTVAGLPR